MRANSDVWGAFPCCSAIKLCMLVLHSIESNRDLPGLGVWVGAGDSSNANGVALIQPRVQQGEFHEPCGTLGLRACGPRPSARRCPPSEARRGRKTRGLPWPRHAADRSPRRLLGQFVFLLTFTVATAYGVWLGVGAGILTALTCLVTLAKWEHWDKQRCERRLHELRERYKATRRKWMVRIEDFFPRTGRHTSPLGATRFETSFGYLERHGGDVAHEQMHTSERARTSAKNETQTAASRPVLASEERATLTHSACLPKVAVWNS